MTGVTHSQLPSISITVSIETRLAVIESLCQVEVLLKYFFILKSPARPREGVQELPGGGPCQGVLPLQLNSPSLCPAEAPAGDSQALQCQ